MDTGRFLRMPKMQSWWPAVFSNDGKVAVWVVPSKDGDEVHFARLDATKPRDIETPFRLTQWHAFAISPDGSRMVTIDKEGILTVDDLGSGKSLGSARVPGANRSNAVFVNPGLLRVYAFSDSGTSIFEYDVARKTLTPTGNAPKAYPRFNVDRSRMLLITPGQIEVHDPRSGALLQSMPGRFETAKYLRDGRIVAIAIDRKSVTIFSSGAPLNIAVPADRTYETLAGPVVACSKTGCSVIDTASGAVLRTEPGIQPLSWYNTATTLLSKSGDRIVVWNPATGEKRPMS